MLGLVSILRGVSLRRKTIDSIFGFEKGGWFSWLLLLFFRFDSFSLTYRQELNAVWKSCQNTKKFHAKRTKIQLFESTSCCSAQLTRERVARARLCSTSRTCAPSLNTRSSSEAFSRILGVLAESSSLFFSWVEQDPKLILETVAGCAKRV